MKNITFLLFLLLTVSKIAEAGKLPFLPDTISGKKIDSLLTNQAFKFYRFDDSVSLSFFIDDDTDPQKPLFVSLLIYGDKVVRTRVVNDYTLFDEESIFQIEYVDDAGTGLLEQYWQRKYQRIPDYKSIPQNTKEIAETFGTACGAAGMPMGKGTLYQQLRLDKDLSIGKLLPYLYSFHPAERLAAFLVLSDFESVPEELNSELLNIKSNPYRFSYCSGCTVRGNYTAKEIYQDFFGSSR